MMSAQKNSRRVLLVEDNRTDAMLICLCLQKMDLGIKIDHCTTTDEALLYTSQRSTATIESAERETIELDTEVPHLPELVVLDLNLPGRGGYAILREIRATPALETVPVIIFSTSSYKEDILAAYDCGANDYITKPADFSSFRTVLQTSVQAWLSSEVVT